MRLSSLNKSSFKLFILIQQMKVHSNVAASVSKPQRGERAEEQGASRSQ
jgi:hypothetical protein